MKPHRVPGGKLILHPVIVTFVVMVVGVDDARTVVDHWFVQSFADRRTGIRDRGWGGRRDALKGGPIRRIGDDG